MKKMKWSEVPDTDGDFERLAPGGYVAKITDADDHFNPSDEYVEVVWDVAEGDKAGYYSDEWGQRNTWALSTRWYYRDNCTGIFRSRLRALEESNPGKFYIDRWEVTCDPRAWIGLEFGAIIQKRLYTKRDGSDGEALEIVRVVSADKIRKGDYTLPEPRDARKAKPTQAKPADAYSSDIPF